MIIQLFQNHLLKRLSFLPLHYLGIFVKKYFGRICVELFLELLFCSTDLFSLFIPHYLDYYSLIISLEIK